MVSVASAEPDSTGTDSDESEEIVIEDEEQAEQAEPEEPAKPRSAFLDNLGGTLVRGQLP
jgi:hypothetical protein